jgi:macrolide transport system ATP-binding/permease protein
MSLLRRISNLFFRSRIDQEIDQELTAHIEMRFEENRAAGMSSADARRDALLRFGNRAATKESVTGVDAALMLATIWSDLRYASRQLLKNPLFAGTAILVLGLGIGSSVTLFGFVDAALIRPLPYSRPSRLAAVFESNPIGPRFHLSYLDYLDYKKLNTVFSSLDAYKNDDVLLTTPRGLEQVRGSQVSDGFFRTLGVQPILGRNFAAGEDLPSAPRHVLLSYAAWQNRYGGNSNVLGQAVTLDGNSNTIIGVLPTSFHFAPTEPTEFWSTLHLSMAEDRGAHGLSGIARLKDGVTMNAAEANMTNLAEQLARQYPKEDTGRGATIAPLGEVILGNMRPILLVLQGGASLLLLIACLNVGSLILVRSESRRREVAVRGALGASHLRLLRQFITEGFLLVSIGTVLGLGSAFLAGQLLLRMIPVLVLDRMPYLREAGMNAHVIAFACTVAILALLLFSLLPAMRLYLSGKSLGMQAQLAEGGRGSAGTLWRRVGPTLVLVELATAMVLLTGAGLLGKSFYRLLHTDIGFRPEKLAALGVSASGMNYTTDAQNVVLGKSLVEQLKSLPGVANVGICSQLPLGEGFGSTGVNIVGRPQSKTRYEENGRVVSSNYFATMGTRLLRGRFFTEDDNASKPPVMIINQAFARKYFPDQDPLGQRIYNGDPTHAMEIVGIVEDLKEGPLDVETRPVMYAAFDQGPENWFYVVVRSTLPEQMLLPTLVAAIHQLDPNIATSDETSMSVRLHDSPAAYLHRSSAWLVGGFATVALLLSVVGLYGVISYSVSRRTREIGVRMAVGAERASVYLLILKEAGRLTAIGILAGLICSVGAAILMRKLLFGTQAWDAATLAAVAGVLAVSAMLASYLPAHRAASVDPAHALRAE